MTAGNNGTAAHLWPSAEQHLLLEAALRDGAPSLASFQTWCSGFDMDAYFGHQTMRLLPLVYDNMQRQGMRAPMMGRLKGVYRRAWYETHRLFHLAQPVIAALHANGIEVLLLKGAPLALSYYGNHALRPMADVDIMVSAADIDRALAIVEDLGWTAPVPFDRDVRRFRHAVQYFGPNGGEIDLHWHVLYEVGSEDADRRLRNETEPGDFLGIPVRQLDPTGLLLVVILHGVRWNAETPIRWIPDALTVLRRRGADIDWDRMVDYAIAHRVTDRLGLGMEYLVESFAAPIPREVVARVRGRRASLQERAERKALLADNSRLEESVLGTYWLWFVDYWRYGDSGGPLAFANGFAHYIRYRARLRGRRDILPLVVRGIGHRLTRRPAAPTTAGDA